MKTGNSRPIEKRKIEKQLYINTINLKMYSPMFYSFKCFTCFLSRWLILRYSKHIAIFIVSTLINKKT